MEDCLKALNSIYDKFYHFSTNKVQKFPTSRISGMDFCGIGIKKHPIAEIIALDVTISREKRRRCKQKLSFHIILRRDMA